MDQLAPIGALPVAVARAAGVDVAYLPGLAVRRIADLHPGNAKTDARDTYVIADAARTMPHTLRRVDLNDDALADLEVTVGFDDDLAGKVARVINRIHGLLTQIHPALERALGPRLHREAVLELLTRFCEPTVPGAGTAELVIPELAAQLIELLQQSAAVAAQVGEILHAHPLAPPGPRAAPDMTTRTPCGPHALARPVDVRGRGALPGTGVSRWRDLPATLAMRTPQRVRGGHANPAHQEHAHVDQ